MRWTSAITILAGTIGLLAGPAPCEAVDYAKLDRRIKNEPAYESKSPLYGLLLFGREAETRVWVVLDGETVYLDRNADGDLTAPDERFDEFDKCRDIQIAGPAGTKYVIDSIGDYREDKPPTVHLMANVTVDGPLDFQQYCDVRMDESPQKAALAHFDGPLTAGSSTINWELPRGLALTRGEKPEEIYAIIGTLDAKHGLWTVVRTHKGQTSAFPEGVAPELEVEFPAKVAGAPPFTRTYPLSGFCWGCLIHGPVRVPDEAANGTAKVTFRFDAWKDAHVAPSTIEILVKDPEPDEEKASESKAEEKP